MKSTTPQLTLSADDRDYIYEKLPELGVFAKVNKNFAPDALTAGAEQELAKIIYKEDGTRWRKDAIERHIEQKRIGVRSRTNQILMGVPTAEAGVTPPNNPMWREKPQGNEYGDLSAASRSVAKIAQKLWTNRNDLQGECDDPRYIDIDPEMLSDSVLRALDLEEFVPAVGGPPISKEKRLERYAQAIPHIRAMIRNLVEPMERFESGFKRKAGKTDPRLHNYRMFVIKHGKNAGKLFIVHQKSERGEYTFQVTDLPSAARRLTHIDAQYKNKDLQQINELPNLLRTLLSFAQSKDWATVKKEPRLAKTLRKIDAHIFAMMNVRNDFKQEIRDAIVDLRTRSDGGVKAGLADATGKTNPTAAASQIEALIRRFESDDSFTERAIEIGNISGYLTQDDHILFTQLKQHNDFYSDFTQFVEEHCNTHLKFIGPKETDDLQETVSAFETRMQRPQLAPFASFAALIKTYFASASTELNSIKNEFEAQASQRQAEGKSVGSSKAVTHIRPAAALPVTDEHTTPLKDGADTLALPRQHLVGAYVAAKAEQITSQLSQACEEAVLLIEYNGNNNFEKLTATLEEAQKLVSSREVADKYYPREFNPLWEKFKNMIGQCRVAVDTAKGTTDKKTRNIYLEDFKENIKAFVAHDVIPFINRLALFRADASTDKDGNLYMDIVSLDVEHTGQWTEIPPALRPQSGRPLSKREQAAKEKTLGEQPHVIQVGAVKQRFVLDRSTGEIVALPNYQSEISFNAKPPCAIIPEAQAVHGISIEQLEGESPMSARIKEIGDFFEGTHGVVGHNVRTDMACLLAEAARAAGKPPETKLKSLKLPSAPRFPHNMYDTVHAGQSECRLISEETGLYKFPQLGQLYSILFPGETIENAHDALADAKATMRCFVELVMRNAAQLGKPHFRLE